MAKPFVSSGVWPVFSYVVAVMDEHRMDARKTLASLPRVPDSLSMIGRPSYGFTTFPVEAVQEDTRLGLTVAAGLVVPELRALISEPFLSVLHQMIKLYREAPASPDKGKEVWCTSVQMRSAISFPREAFWVALPTILGFEVATRRGSSNSREDGFWKREITRDILPYEDVRSAEDYVTKVCGFVSSWASEYDQLLSRDSLVPRRLEDIPVDRTPDEPMDQYQEENSRQEIEGQDQDRAKSTRIMKTVPLDARWLAFLATGRPLHRIPDWLTDVVNDAYAALKRDVVDFINPELFAAHKAFIDALDVLTDSFGDTFPPLHGNGAYTEIPPEWKRTQRDQYYETLKSISTARDDVLHTHKELVNIMNRFGQLSNSEMPSSQSFQLRTGDNSPVTVYASQAYAGHGAVASSNANPTSEATNKPGIPKWNRNFILWPAIGAVATVLAAVAAIMALK
ncbi:hypothetical protein ACGFYV_08430 [Streptomyces sp. NPDC048297]|uniref:hypothetical protein n=1 Tax=Streptomyces sp. NPDC048297 TaxID=3365531 RepID=UPI00371D2C30